MDGGLTLALTVYHQIGAERGQDVFPLAPELGLRRLAEDSSQGAAGAEAASGLSGEDEAGSGAAAAAVQAGIGTSTQAGIERVKALEGSMSFPSRTFTPTLAPDPNPNPRPKLNFNPNRNPDPNPTPTLTVTRSGELPSPAAAPVQARYGRVQPDRTLP